MYSSSFFSSNFMSLLEFLVFCLNLNIDIVGGFWADIQNDTDRFTLIWMWIDVQLFQLLSQHPTEGREKSS